MAKSAPVPEITWCRYRIISQGQGALRRQSPRMRRDRNTNPARTPARPPAAQGAAPARRTPPHPPPGIPPRNPSSQPPGKTSAHNSRVTLNTGGYNDSFQDFTNTVDGSSVPSDLSDYQIAPHQGSENPWRTGQLGQAMNFTVRVIPGATAAQQRSENAIPMIDQNPPANPTGPPGLGYVIFRTYIPSGGNTTVQLPTV